MPIRCATAAIRLSRCSRDLSDPDVRFNLYAAVRVQEILVDMHILPDGYVGKVNEKVHGSEAAVNY